jgi:hypothetical protein
MMDGIIHFESCNDQEARWTATIGQLKEFQCDYYEFKVFAWNLTGLLAITLWAGVLSFLMFFGLNKLGILR